MSEEGLLHTHEPTSVQGGPPFTVMFGQRHGLFVHRSVNEITQYPDGRHRHLYRRTGEYEQCELCGRLAIFQHVGPADEEGTE